MKIINIISQKGGCGKSTITTNLARGLQLRQYNVAVLDLDNQKSVSSVLSQSSFKIDVFTGFVDKKSLQDYDYVLIDNAPRLEQKMIDIVRLSDYILIPVKASVFDYIATQDILDMINQILSDKRRNLVFKTGIVLNNCTNQKIADELKELLLDDNYNILAEIKKRNAYEIEIDKTVYEHKNKVAINEFDYFIDMLLDDIKKG